MDTRYHLRIQCAGRVKADASGGIGIKHTIDDDAVKVEMGVEQCTKAVDEDHGAEAGRCTSA